jgi:nucleoid DNA-binding protein
MRLSCFYSVKQKIHPTSIISGYRLACKEAVKYIQDHLTYKVSKSEQIFTVIADPGFGAFLTSGTGIREEKNFGTGMKEHPRSFFRELRNSFYFLGLNILKFIDVFPDPGSGILLVLDPGSGMEKFGSGINLPDPQR